MSHLKSLLLKHGINQTDLAHLLGRDKSVVTNLFQGKRRLKADEATVIAEHIGVPVAQILGVQEKGSSFHEPQVLIPFHHEPEHCKKNAGVVKKEGKFYLEADENSGYSPKAYALEVRDESMNLSGIMPGDIIISELNRTCKPGQIVIAQHYQGRGAKTIIRKYQPPFLMAHSTLAGFEPLSLENEQARLVSPVMKLIRAF